MRAFTLLSTLLATALASPINLITKEDKPVWHPAVSTKWQIILSGVLDISQPVVPADAPVWDLDLANTPTSTITAMKEQGYKVICYYSAGTGEQFRPETNQLPQDVFGAVLPKWPDERWLDIRRPEVIQLAKDRIARAAEKGCDAIDPDNIDVFDNEHGGGFAQPITEADSIAFMRIQADEAHRLGMAIGLKNSMSILPSVGDFVDFAVNEQCAEMGECGQYTSFLASGKPVFQIEYENPSQNLARSCAAGSQFSLVQKPDFEVDGRAYYCDGSFAQTATYASPDKGGPATQN